MLHINNACIAFGAEVLFSGFNLNLEQGETACIVGQSGCGKTSLLNAVMGFVPLREGTIQVGGTLLDISTIDVVRRQIAWIPQEHELYVKRVNEVSGGQRQRITLAVAAMLNKPLIIIDEPTSALDAGATDKVLSFFRRQAERGAAVLAVSHDKDFAAGCHYVIEL